MATMLQLSGLVPRYISKSNVLGRVVPHVLGRRHRSDDLPRYNPVNIQMLSASLHEQLFPDTPANTQSTDVIQKCIEHLSAHGLWGKTKSAARDVDMTLPPLLGENIDDHFRTIARQQSKAYYDMSQDIASSSLPSVPDMWEFRAGWCRYAEDADGLHVTQVECPPDDALVFDVEVLQSEGLFPTLAVAASPSAWYSWVSPRLVKDKSYQWIVRPRPDLYIPLETSDGKETHWRERLVIGHSVGYDRSYVKEQYYIKGPKTYFLDTLSLHMCVSGLTGLQRHLWTAANSGRKTRQDWMQAGAGNKLVDLYALYCDGEAVDKSLVDVFIHGDMGDVRAQFQDLMAYCAKDVSLTHEVFAALWPFFLERFPHPVTFAGMLEMGSAYLPIDQSWDSYLRDCNDTYEDLEQEMKGSLMHLADEACNYHHDRRYSRDPWLWSLDWSVQDVRTKVPKKPKKPKKKKTSTSAATITLDRMESDSLECPSNNELIHNEDKEEVFDEWNLIKMEKYGMLGNAARDTGSCEEAHDQSEKTTQLLSAIPPAEEIMYKRRQHLPGYPFVFQSLWQQHRMNPLTSSPSPSPLDDEELDIRHLTDSDMWSEYEYQEIKANGKQQGLEGGSPRQEGCESGLQGSSPGREGVQCTKLQSTKKKLDSDWRHSKPPSYHGVGPFNDVDLPGVWFFRIPHKNGDQYRCGNPLAKDYITKLDDKTLVSAGDRSARRTLVTNKMISFWRNAHKRITSQMAVWFGADDLPDQVKRSAQFSSHNTYGAIVPRVISAGTVTRRAVEPTWLTASNPREDRVGSELKSLVRAPPGYSLVGADVDSQELWIAAVLGDANFAGIHGCTAFGWMTLQGQKSDGTDLHSKTADTIGISRDHAKVFNYGRIYGAGQKFAERLLLQFNHRLTDTEARQKAERLYSSTKGTARYVLSDYGHEVAHEFGIPVDEDGCVETRVYWELVRRTTRRRRNKNFKKSIEAGRRWHGGSESEMFNKLEMIAQSDEPRTPVLGCRISRALEPWVVGGAFITSRVNWVVQSSAVDYLHLMLVSMKWLFTEYGIDGRFCISIHDEVRYLVAEEDKYRAALALQITNLLTRAMFAYKLGMNDLPQSVAFFSAVDIDKVLRKEVNLDCKTPSNPQGLQKGQGIMPGEALDIHQILQKTNGCLRKVEHLNVQDSVQ
ncbi:DNA polymerase subunit gamma-1-like isoform X2 [Nematostella vectensis]|uniref:DNA polymerase subunit gamma-1-like isoform X2 n=1 Tax=Nematostella vectensis TaxID=45351 RepID=UPI0020778A05|nr:DNA polymerase subunit gamma-1-like isoform X2 [Nematostella vectensis]